MDKAIVGTADWNIPHAILQPTENNHKIANAGTVTFDSKWKAFTITLPDALMAIPEIEQALLHEFNLKPGETKGVFLKPQDRKSVV